MCRALLPSCRIAAANCTVLRICGLLPLSLLLISCAAVDQFGSRIYDGNLNSQNAMNQEILVNIIRASRLQSTNFMAITQVSGTQTETLTTGLPSVTFGPAQTVAQHQYQISNSVASGVTGTYQANPLVSSAFSEGMLSPISLRTVALLLGSHPREAVFDAIIESIQLKYLDHNNQIVAYWNDATPQNDSLPENTRYRSCQELSDAAQARNDVRFFLQEDSFCNYTKFVNIYKLFMSWGLYAELVPARGGASKAGTPSSAASTVPLASPSPTPSMTSNSTASPQATGQICFSLVYALEGSRSRVASSPELKPALCGTKGSMAGSTSSANTASPIKVTMGALGRVQLDNITFRSPAGVFSYLGKLYREHAGDRVRYFTAPLVASDAPFLDIVEGAGDCFVLVTYEGQSYCVPHGSSSTALLIDLLVQLRNLSITPSDLNSAFSIRLIQ
jgi:hypothetical protein